MARIQRRVKDLIKRRESNPFPTTVRGVTTRTVRGEARVLGWNQHRGGSLETGIGEQQYHASPRLTCHPFSPLLLLPFNTPSSLGSGGWSLWQSASSIVADSSLTATKDSVNSNVKLLSHFMLQILGSSAAVLCVSVCKATGSEASPSPCVDSSCFGRILFRVYFFLWFYYH